MQPWEPFTQSCRNWVTMAHFSQACLFIGKRLGEPGSIPSETAMVLAPTLKSQKSTPASGHPATVFPPTPQAGDRFPWVTGIAPSRFLTSTSHQAPGLSRCQGVDPACSGSSPIWGSVLGQPETYAEKVLVRRVGRGLGTTLPRSGDGERSRARGVSSSPTEV